ncbi:unnamed protein product [Boreogadus saida]
MFQKMEIKINRESRVIGRALSITHSPVNGTCDWKIRLCQEFQNEWRLNTANIHMTQSSEKSVLKSQF